ncbi:FmdE family protein [Methanobacterium petrolearium]|uniref:FmdE family protein n=1 Tax=Methanobacterium petrolearium TaxID=710190 RepID=UPI001AE98D65|nr:FmdE family protein [Methanobacterium petrolearium]MBP1944993.1 formylmethanofuran dehydrogenase subunit E [Methanobacterium petrolearium]BDZ70317.1 formylmethanofuran dehydrogenase subunit E [Methanobacterium petrolearium]
MDEIIAKIDDPEILPQIDKVVPFHGYLSTGAFIGLQMLKIASELLDINDDDRIFVTCETLNCLPDPFQILHGCTVGNKGLKILDYDKMAVTINKGAKPGETNVKGVRIFLDPAKTAKYPVFHAWYMNERKVPHEEAISELIKAGDDVYTWEFVDVQVPVKAKKDVRICTSCGESFISKDGSTVCKGCLEKL